MPKDEHPSEAPVSPSNAVSISSSGILSMLILILAFKKRRGKRFSLNWWTAMEILLYRILALSELRPMFREAIKNITSTKTNSVRSAAFLPRQ